MKKWKKHPPAEAEEKKSDQEPVRRKKKKRWKVVVLILLCLLSFAAGIVLWLMQREEDFVESFYQIQSEKLTDNIRVVLLSDLHLREFGEKNCELIGRIEALKPDLIAIAGDMNLQEQFEHHVVTELCEALVELAPVYYVPGNHELGQIVFHESTIEENLVNAGVHLLVNQQETIELKGNTIKIGGLANPPMQYEKYGTDFFEAFEQGEEFKLLLVHYPEYFSGALQDADIDVALCGHAHGGQVRIPGIGGLYTMDQGWFPELTEGLHKIHDISVVISRGLGDSSKVPRINNPPELVIVDMNWY